MSVKKSGKYTTSGKRQKFMIWFRAAKAWPWLTLMISATQDAKAGASQAQWLNHRWSKATNPRVPFWLTGILGNMVLRKRNTHFFYKDQEKVSFCHKYRPDVQRTLFRHNKCTVNFSLMTLNTRGWRVFFGSRQGLTIQPDLVWDLWPSLLHLPKA